MKLPKIVRDLLKPNEDTVKEIKQQLLEEMAAEKKAQEEEQLRLKQEAEERVARELEAEKRAKAEAREQMKNSDKPWVEVISMVEDPTQGAKIELDWNDAFIVYLKNNGFTGITDDQIIQKYIAVLLRNIVLETEMMEEDESDESDNTE